MILTKKQIKELESALVVAEKLESSMFAVRQSIADLIEKFTDIDGYVECLPGDGFGFTLDGNCDAYIPVGELIKIAKDGVDITRYEMYSRRSI